LPTLDDALEFVRDPDTSESRLRRACEILELNTLGDEAVLRRRLLERLSHHPASQEVVCLNPNLPRE
jgi:hypothetical protein